MRLAAENQVPWLMCWFIHRHKYQVSSYAQGVCLSNMQSPSGCCYLGNLGFCCCCCWSRLEDDKYLGESHAGSGELEELPESESGAWI